MSDRDYQSMRLQSTIDTCREYFHVNLPIKDVLFDDIEISDNGYCVLFRTENNNLYGLLIDEASQTLQDVKRRAKNLGIEIEGYASPYGDQSYFTRAGKEAFKNAYPGRHQWTAQEAEYFRLQTSYSPALVRVANVNGELHRYNKHDRQWQPVYDFTYHAANGSHA